MGSRRVPRMKKGSLADGRRPVIVPVNRYRQMDGKQVHPENLMAHSVFSRDVRPITDFKAKGSEIVEQVARTRRPVLITRRGRGVAVVVDLGEFERMRDEIAFGRAVDEAAAQAARGEFATDAEVEAALLGRRR